MDFTNRPETRTGKLSAGLMCVFGLFMLDAGVIFAGANLMDKPENKKVAQDVAAVALIFGMASTLTQLGSEGFPDFKNTARAHYKK